MNYNLAVIQDKEFEELCKALFEKELGVPLQIFKKGVDKGIDLRYAGQTNNEIVIQAKHYLNSKFSDLKYVMANTEKPNIEKLVPPPLRYIVATSLGLNTNETDTLVNILSPFVKSTDDIFGIDRILELMRDNPDVVTKFYKLWLTSSDILQRILFNGITGNSEFFEEKILRKVGLYVQTSDFNDALDRLKENHFLIITGEPGIGKTTIAYLLICNLLANDFQLIYVDNDLKEASDLISPDPEKKQVIFYDDFLGSNIYDLMYPKNTESTIVNLIDRVQALKNKFLVLTTRTTILNQAHYAYAKLKRSGAANISKYEIKLSNYSSFNKAQILYNHLFQSKNSEALFNAAIKDKNYLRIINHHNYSPRLIEFITTSENFRNSAITDLVEFIFFNLNNPQEIWRDAYEKQIGDVERFLLTTLFSLGGYNIDETELQTAFDERYRFEINNNGFTLVHNAFNTALKKLLDGLIQSTKNIETGRNVYSFINPSVGDFLLYYLKDNTPEKWRILCGIKYVSQLTSFFDPLNKAGLSLTEPEKERFFPVFHTKSKTLIPSKKECLSNDLAFIYLMYFPSFVTDKILTEIFLSILDENNAENQFEKLLKSVSYSYKFPNTKDLILNNWNKLINLLYSGAKDSMDFQNIIELFEEYDCSLEEYLEDEDNRDEVELALVSCFHNSNDEDYSSELDYIIENYHRGFTRDAATVIRDRIDNNYYGFVNDCGLSDFFSSFTRGVDLDENDILSDLIKQHEYEDDYDDDYRYPEAGPTNYNEQNEIDDLFQR